MKSVLLRLLCWLSGWIGCVAEVAAQPRTPGPWRTTYLPTRVRVGTWESGYWPDGTPPIDTACYAAKLKGLPLSVYDWCPASDTTTTLHVQRRLSRAPWTVSPDAIVLFLNCQNALTAPVSPRAKHKQLRFVATGATVQLDFKQRQLLLVPAQPVVVLKAYRGQQLLFRHTFQAVCPPLPNVVCQDIDGRRAIIERPRPNEEQLINYLLVRAAANEDFATMMPADARYRVANASFVLIRQGKADAPTVISSYLTPLYSRQFAGLPGDAIQVDVQLVQRQNFQGKRIDLPLTKHQILSYPRF